MFAGVARSKGRPRDKHTPYYVVVPKFFEQGYLADGGGGCAFFRIQVDFLQGDNLVGCARTALMHRRDESEAAINRFGPTLYTVAYVPSPSFSSCRESERRKIK